MAVEYIKYKNKKLPVKVGYYVLKRMQTEHGVDLNTTQEGIVVYEPMLFYALEQGHKLTKKNFPFKMEDMEDILDECLFDFLEILPRFFPEEMAKMMGVGGQEQSQKGL